MNPTAGEDSISPMAPILRGRFMAPVRHFGMPLYFKDDDLAIHAVPKTGFRYFLVCLAAMLPVIVMIWAMSFPMVVANMPFSGNTVLDYCWFFVVLPKFGFTFLDQFGAALMISPFYIGGLLSFYLWSRQVCDRLTHFLELYCEKLGSLVSPGKKLKCNFMFKFS